MPPQRFLIDSGSEFTCRHPEILRTNRQIYSEAASVLYSELTIMLEPADIPGMRRKHAKGMGIPKKTVWRHNPLDGIGYCKEDGSHLYNTPPMDGLMEPHVFARFQRITFHADFNFTAAESYLYIDDDFKVDSDDRARFIAFLRRPGIFTLLTRLLSNSPSLHRLSIALNVEVWPNYDTYSDESDEEKDFKKMEAANEHAADIFMDSGILNPLRKMSNVKCFEFLYDMMTYKSKFYQPQPRHFELIQDLQVLLSETGRSSKNPDNTSPGRRLLSKDEASE